MKQILLIIPGLFICFFSFAQEIWTVDNSHSNLRFEVGWEDFSMRTGEFKIFEGTIETYSRDDLSNAVFTFKVDASSVDVIADRLADHVKSDRFLNVEIFPEIKFSSSGVKVISDSTYISTGKIEIHGIEKEQEVSVWLKGQKKGRRSQILGLEVELILNRKDFGLDWGSPRLGETIKIVGHLLFQMRINEE
jgi:polyisoprenoid-binding protein YceI